MSSHIPSPMLHYDVFLSYTRTDKKTMEFLLNLLRAANWQVWADPQLKTGDLAWDQTVSTAIRESRCMVVILSPDAVKSGWVNREIAFAEAIGKERGQNKFSIFPIWIKGSESESIPLRLQTSNWIDARADFDQQNQVLQDGGKTQKLIDDLRGYLSQHPIPLTPVPPVPSKGTAVASIASENKSLKPSGKGRSTEPRMPGWLTVLVTVLGVLGIGTICAALIGLLPIYFPPSSTPTAEASCTNIALAVTATPAAEMLANNIEVREGPGVNYPRIATLQKSDRLDIVSKTPNGDWYQIVIQSGNLGWIRNSGSLVRVCGDVAVIPTATSTNTPTQTNTPTSTVTETPTLTNTPTLIDTSTNTLTQTATSTPTPGTTATATGTETPDVVLTADNLTATAQAQQTSNALFQQAFTETAVASIDPSKLAVANGQIDRVMVLDNEYIGIFVPQAFSNGACVEGHRDWWEIPRSEGWTWCQDNALHKYIPPTRPPSEASAMVFWYEANAYCRSVGGRLPTEAEWRSSQELIATKGDGTLEWTSTVNTDYPDEFILVSLRETKSSLPGYNYAGNSIGFRCFYESVTPSEPDVSTQTPVPRSALQIIADANDSYLILYVPSNAPPVSMTDMELKVVIDDQHTESHRPVNDFSALILSHGMANPGTCYIYEQVGINVPIVERCRLNPFTHPLTRSGIFWFDVVQHRQRDIGVVWGGTLTICSATQPVCEVIFPAATMADR